MTFVIKLFSVKFAKRQIFLRVSIMNLQLHSNVTQIMEVYVFFKFKIPTWMILYKRHNYDEDVSEIK